jgi:hypothetical protein
MKLLNYGYRNLLARFMNGKLNTLETEQLHALLQQFFAGELDEAESDEIIEILAANQTSLEIIDQLSSQSNAQAQTPVLKNEVVQRLESNLMQRIHVSNMLGAVLKMGTRGFASVTMGLLRPFIHRHPKHARHKRSRK